MRPLAPRIAMVFFVGVSFIAMIIVGLLFANKIQWREARRIQNWFKIP
jgi:hypothetical protein